MRLRQAGHHRQQGMTLVELLIGLTIGLLVLAVVGTAFINILRSSNDTLSSIKLSQEVRGLMGFMTSDIRRAGYWENAATASIDSTIAYDNPLTHRDGATGDIADIWIHDGGTCLMYSYDRGVDGDSDGDLEYWSDGQAQPLIGYRLNNNGQIEGTIPGELVDRAGDAHDGQTDSCTAGGTGGAANDNGQIDFEAMTDDRIIEVTDLTFSTTGSTCINLSADSSDPNKKWTLLDNTVTTPACETIPASVTVNNGDRLLEIRRIRISIEARHLNDNEIRTVLSDTVNVRNNRLLIH
ncbi:prepilin-type N-terminal cleavage/methylation domain-containing protein [Guyparkeria sp. 1SP6A2]|nr:prepilin-type N-terminal cleavage/methylation domain-containing protein [Guyparkeria sp. 1SP6A2]